MNIVIMGAHPDDPESGCGGLAIKAASSGHHVAFLYMSSGHPGTVIDGREEIEIREEEARAACAICGAEPYFPRYPMSHIPFDCDSVQWVSDFMAQVDADLILGHWPVDSHPDHQACGALVTQAVVGNPGVALAYYEVCTGFQTFAFEPNRFVDISGVAGLKKKAVDCHVSQNVDSWWSYHDAMERFRVPSAGVKRAEGYYLAVSTSAAEQIFTVRTSLPSSGSRTTRPVKHEKIGLYLDQEFEREES